MAQQQLVAAQSAASGGDPTAAATDPTAAAYMQQFAKNVHFLFIIYLIWISIEK